jgi:phosphohistidine phosphatase
MRRLLLVRHAKAERSQPGGRDRDRVLAERGRADALKLGAYMVRHAFLPDLAVVSTAARTRETWQQIAAAFQDCPPARFEDRIYEVSPDAILAVIKETGTEIGTLLLIGHNPGLQELAAVLVGSGDVDSRQRMKEDFPTSTLAVINFALENWGLLHRGAGRLEHFVTPQSLTSRTD